ncbi:MAG: MFS transporter [Actinomycetota bacterium]
MQAAITTAKKVGFWKSGHWPTLLVSLLYFDFCFAIWVLNGAMAPFIAGDLGLSAAQKGFMVSVPIISGSLIRFPLGLLGQYIGRKWSAVIEMGTIMVALVYGSLFVDSYREVLFMGVLLGIAGASFGIALSLGSGSYPPRYKGLAAAVAGAGNSGAVLAVLFAPPLAKAYGWHLVYAMSILPLLLPMALMLFVAKEPEDREHQGMKDYLKVLIDRDTWVMNIIYIVTFGGYIGFTNVLPIFFNEQYGIDKARIGGYSALIIIMASLLRVGGGWVADKIGGLRVLNAVFVVALVSTLLASTLPSSVVVATLILMVLFGALGAGNGATFQLVPLRFTAITSIAMSMVGLMGGLGGFIPPNAFGQAKQITGSFSLGFIVFAGVIIVAWIAMLAVQRKWTTSWVGKGGKAKIHVEVDGPVPHKHQESVRLREAEEGASA